MTTKKNLVKSMLMSILTAGIYGFAFAFTACSDDELANANSMEDGSDKIGNYADFEPYGLTYHNFDNADDVQILNADTTEIAVRKSLADKLGITNFENHPLGIWDDPSHLAQKRDGIYFVEFQRKDVINPQGYYLITGNDTKTYPKRNPKSWKILGKRYPDDEWTTIAEVKDYSLPAENLALREFKLDVPYRSMQYFRFEVSEIGGGDRVQLSELVFK